jgi:hypothetical protein
MISSVSSLAIVSPVAIAGVISAALRAVGGIGRSIRERGDDDQIANPLGPIPDPDAELADRELSGHRLVLGPAHPAGDVGRFRPGDEMVLSTQATPASEVGIAGLVEPHDDRDAAGLQRPRGPSQTGFIRRRRAPSNEP